MTIGLPDHIHRRLRVPVIAAPMFLVSGVELVVAACRAGVIGSFPTVNCRTSAVLDAWLDDITVRLRSPDGAGQPAPYCPNLIVHKSNPRLAADLDILVKHRPEMVITSVGSPAPVIEPLHRVGALVLADVATVYQARKAVAAGADGLVLLTAGAGGQTGWLNPLGFARAVRSFFSGPLVLAGGIADGAALAAALQLGCDLGYMGTKFIATTESLAAPDYKQMLVDSGADDILLTSAMTGLPTSILRPSLLRAGLDPDNLPQRGAIDIATDIDVTAAENKPKRWRDVWSAGHSVAGVTEITTVADLVAQTRKEFLCSIKQSALTAWATTSPA